MSDRPIGKSSGLTRPKVMVRDHDIPANYHNDWRTEWASKRGQYGVEPDGLMPRTRASEVEWSREYKGRTDSPVTVACTYQQWSSTVHVDEVEQFLNLEGDLISPHPSEILGEMECMAFSRMMDAREAHYELRCED